MAEGFRTDVQSWNGGPLGAPICRHAITLRSASHALRAIQASTRGPGRGCDARQTGHGTARNTDHGHLGAGGGGRTVEHRRPGVQRPRRTRVERVHPGLPCGLGAGNSPHRTRGHLKYREHFIPAHRPGRPATRPGPLHVPPIRSPVPGGTPCPTTPVPSTPSDSAR